MKRSNYKTNVTHDATCMECHVGIDDRTGVRSNSWFKGVLGVRAILCSEVCRDKFDVSNRVYVANMEVSDA